MEHRGLDNFKKSLQTLIRARYPIILCETHEEQRFLRVLEDIAQKRSMNLIEWSCTKGFSQIRSTKTESITNPEKALVYVAECPDQSLIVLKDFTPYLKDIGIQRRMRELAQSLKLCQKTLFIVGTSSEVPEALQKDISFLSMPLPCREEIKSIFTEIDPTKFVLSDEDIESTATAAAGLTFDEAENAIAKSLVEFGKLSATGVLEEKRQIVKKAGILEYIELAKSHDAIGGLDNLKHWIKTRRRGFGKEAQERRLPPPKGILMVGLPGCGKSLTAQCTGLLWQMPLLRLDIGRIFSGLVGSSEANMRKALQTCEAVAPCILWIDEIEKAFASASGGGGDSGTSARVFGSFLTWMQEKSSSVFVIATANDISQLPPELLRKGRFDEIFFVDLPNENERQNILDIHLSRKKWLISDFDAREFQVQSEGMSGAELEQALIDASYEAFFYDETLAFRHLRHALQRTVPLSRTMKEKFQTMRAWAKERAVPASVKPVSENPMEERNRLGEINKQQTAQDRQEI